MRISVWPNSIAMNAHEPYSAVVTAIRQTDQVVEQSWDADAALIWSVLWNGRMRPNQAVWNHYRRQNKPVIVVEVGCLHRGVTWRLCVNGINQNAIWPSLRELDRPSKLGITLRAESDGESVMIAMQNSRSEQWSGMPHPSIWLQSQIRFVRSVTDREIIVRPHPREPLLSKPAGVRVIPPEIIGHDSADFERSISNIHWIVSHNNNVGIEGAIFGKRVMCSPSSLGFEMSCLPDDSLPDRSEWIERICHTEWTVEELAAGHVWQSLRDRL